MDTAPDSTGFDQLLQEARAGNRVALDRLIREYESELVKVVKSRLGNSLRPYFDSVDLIQSVHKSVLLGIRNEKFDIRSPEHLVRLAALIVRRKIARHWRKHQRQQRLEKFGACDNQSLATLLLDSQNTAESPAKEAEQAEKLSLILEQLDPNDRKLIELRLAGCNTAEAARKMQLDSNVLRARLGRLRKKLVSAGFTVEWF